MQPIPVLEHSTDTERLTPEQPGLGRRVMFQSCGRPAGSLPSFPIIRDAASLYEITEEQPEGRVQPGQYVLVKHSTPAQTTRDFDPFSLLVADYGLGYRIIRTLDLRRLRPCRIEIMGEVVAVFDRSL